MIDKGQKYIHNSSQLAYDIYATTQQNCNQSFVHLILDFNLLVSDTSLLYF